MPYIDAMTKQELNHRYPMLPGELNYILTQACQDYINRNLDFNYQKLNDVIGALECCKLEFYRRAVVPYEEKKIKENGDVY